MTKLLGLSAIVLILTGCTEKIEEAKTAAAQAQKLAEAAREAAEAAGAAAEEAAEAAEEAADEAGDSNDVAKSAEEATEKAAQDMGEAMKQVEAMMKGATKGAGGAVEPIGFRDLKEYLPSELNEFELDDSGGQKTKAMGVHISEAHAIFKNKDRGRIEVRIQDFGSVKGFVGMATVGWAMVDIDKESSKGYERTGKEDGFKFHEKWTKSGQRGEVQYFVADRFLVEVKGRKVKMDIVKQVAESIDKKALAKRKNEGVKK